MTNASHPLDDLRIFAERAEAVTGVIAAIPGMAYNHFLLVELLRPHVNTEVMDRVLKVVSNFPIFITANTKPAVTSLDQAIADAPAAKRYLGAFSSLEDGSTEESDASALLDRLWGELSDVDKALVELKLHVVNSQEASSTGTDNG